jgi:hypothetical protein
MVFVARSRFLVYVNALFFGCIAVSALLAELLFSPQLYVGGFEFGLAEFFLGLSWPLMLLAIFAFNLVLSGFVFVSLPGFAAFPLSVVALLVRGVLWGVVLAPLPNWLFVLVLPTFLFEGEAYVFAAVAGMTVGLSWLKSDVVYPGETLSRTEAFRKSLKECLRMYFFVVLFLFVAAVVETATILSLKV